MRLFIDYAEETWVDWCLSLDSEGLSLGLKVRLALNKGQICTRSYVCEAKRSFYGLNTKLSLKMGELGWKPVLGSTSNVQNLKARALLGLEKMGSSLNATRGFRLEGKWTRNKKSVVGD